MQISFWLRRMMMLYSEKALQIIFTSSQTYTIDSKWKSADVFLVGGGGSGGHSAYLSEVSHGGASGAGAGYTLTEKNIDLTSQEVTITIGAGAIAPSSVTNSRNGNNGSRTELIINETTKYADGGKGGKATNSDTFLIKGGDGGSGGGSTAGHVGTSTSTESAVNGKGGSNGNNGEGAHWSYNGTSSETDGGTGQGTTTKAFEENGGTLYCGGGGSGPGYTGANYGTYSESKAGGDGGGGHGAASNISSNATAYGGGGGGGFSGGGGGNGYQGVVMIRLYKNSDRPTNIDWSKCTITL